MRTPNTRHAVILSQQAPRPERLHFLDGIRGWGALVVALYHLYIEIFPISGTAQAAMKRFFIFNGTLAVVLFFVVSGYSLSAGFLRTGNFAQLKRIAAGRYFRLTIPILLSCLAVFACSKLDLLPKPYRTPATEHISDLLKFATVDVYFAFDYSRAPIPPLWTMSIELFGSAIVLGLLIVAGTHRIRIAVYFLATVLSFFKYPLYSAFLAGVTMAELQTRLDSESVKHQLSRAAAIGIPPLLVAAGWLPGHPDLRIWALVGSALAFCLICNSGTRSFLASPVSRFLGEISFPLYLLHALVIRVVGTPLLSRATGKLEIALADAAVVVVALSVACLFRSIDRAGILAARFAGGLIAPARPNSMTGRPTSLHENG